MAANETAPFPLPVWSLVQRVLVVDHSTSHTEIQADTSVSPAALTIHFHKGMGGEANLQDGAPGHRVKASPRTAPCFRCRGCQRSLTRAESGFPSTHSNCSQDAFSGCTHPGSCLAHDGILETPDENLKCCIVMDDWNRRSSHWAVNETITPCLLRTTPS